jgi:tetratricopeptide (TPR) repeat protein
MDSDEVKKNILLAFYDAKKIPVSDLINQLNFDEKIFNESLQELINEGYLKKIDGELYKCGDFKNIENFVSAEDLAKKGTNSEVNNEKQFENINNNIFISYARRDTTGLAKNLFEWLQKRGYHPFFDRDPEKGIPVGEPYWDAKIEISIINSKLLIVLLSPCSVRKKSFCRKEIIFAQCKDIPIIPIIVSEVDIPITIITTQCIEAYKNPDEIFELLQACIDQVIKNGTLPIRENGNIWWESSDTLNFEEEIKQYGSSFVGRDWLLESIDSWISKSKDRVLLLSADPGFGKSALATHFQYYFNVKGLHYCRSSLPASCNPVSWIKFLIKQLAIQFEPFKEQIRQKKPNWSMPPESLFRTLISNPLQECRDQINIDDQWIFVIDGLDESSSIFGPEFIDFIAASAKRVPDWIRLIITSRPDEEIIEKLDIEGVTQWKLVSDDENNFRDVQQFIEKKVEKLSAIQKIENKNLLVQKVTDLSAGNFQFAKVTLDAMSDPNPEWQITYEDLEFLPPKLEGLYKIMFEKRFPKKEIFEQNMIPVIDCLIAAQEPIPKRILLKSSGLDHGQAIKSFSALSQFLILSRETRNRKSIDSRDGNYKVRLFHKSVADWLSKKGDVSHGNYQLATTGYSEYKEQDGNLSLYWVAHLPFHLLKSKMYDQLVTLFLDPVFFNKSWDLNEFYCKSIWNKLEKTSNYKLIEVYRPVLQNPDQYPDEFIFKIAQLITDFGYSNDAIILKKYLVEKYRKEKNLPSLIPIIGELAYDVYTSGSPGEAMELLLEQEALCRSMNDNKNLQICLGRQGNILHDTGFYEMAMEKYKLQEKICLMLNDFYWLQKSYGNQGIIYQLKGNLAIAMDLIKKQEDICRKIHHMGGLQTSLGNQGTIEYIKGNFESALKLFQEQQVICEDIGYLRGLHKSLGNQGLVYQISRNYNLAMKLFEREEKICLDINDAEGLQISIGRRANLLSEIGNLDEALELYKKQEEICKKIRNCEWYQICLGRQAVIHREKMQYDTALQLFQKQETYCRKYGYCDSLQKCLGNIGILYAERELFEEALRNFNEQKEICADKGYHIGLQQALGNIAVVYHIKGDKESARKYYQEQEKVCREFNYGKGLQECLENQKKLT